ncbi:MAG: response regulator [Gemmatimonadetes bacterium]|nr:response regulator [Gemmatimonadota bacterium]
MTNLPLNGRLLFESAPDMYLALTPDLIIAEVSNRYLAATKTTRDGIVGRHIFEVFPDNPDDPNADATRNLRASLERVRDLRIQDSMAVQKYDIPRAAAEGGGFEARFWSPVNTPVLADDGALLGIIHRVEDVTEFVRLKQEQDAERESTAQLRSHTEAVEAEVYRRTLEVAAASRQIKDGERSLREAKDAAERANRAKSDFLAKMSHELRTPLNSIIGFSDVLLEETAGPLTAKQRRFVDNVLTSGRQLLSLINDILDLSKVEAGRMELSMVRVSPAGAVDEVLASLQPLATRKRHALHSELPADLPLVDADPVRLKQILMNLVSNAIKYTPDGGTIAVRAAAVTVDGRTMVRTEVSDTGIGIADADLDRVFDEFEQVGGEYGRAQEGTGLGLALARRLVMLHGGTIGVQSVAGKGSTFHFTLPCAVSAAPFAKPGIATPGTQAADGSKHDGAAPQPPVALVVDDDAKASALLSDYLEGAGFRVVTSTSGADALQQVRTLRPTLVTLDMILPDRPGGVDVLTVIKRQSDTRDIPVIVVSITDDRSVALALGAAAWLVKPVGRHEFLRAVETALRGAPSARPAAR